MPADLTPLLEARSVAVIGASADPMKIGGRPISYLQRLGYTGRIMPVNPARQEVQGLACLPSIAEAGAIDLAIVAAPAPGAAEAVEASLAAGVRALVLFTAGYAEVDEAGAAAQADLADRVRAAGAVMLGPNCLGAVNVHRRLAATFTTALETLDPRPGGFSYMGQSGALGAYWIEMADRAGLGIAKWITTGNEAQANGADALAYLAADRETRVIGAYIEDIKEPERFATAAAAARAAGKTMLALKSGRSALGARAALAHTASNAGEDDWYDGFLRECGATRVRSLSEMIDAARLLAAPYSVPPSPRIAAVTVSGGAGVLICDEAMRHGLAMAEFPSSLVETLRTILPSFARPQNPVDVTGAVVSDKALMAQALTVLARNDACDAIVLFIGSMASIADALIDAVAEAAPIGKPIVTIWMAPPDGVRERIEALGVPVFTEIQPAVAALARASGLPDRA
jgi:acyl-CoA synthetase (NDP forming)